MAGMDLRAMMDAGLEVAVNQPKLEVGTVVAGVTASIAGLASLGAVKHRMSKSELVAKLATASGADKKTVSQVLSHLPAIAAAQLRAGHDFVIPGLVQLKSIHKRATKSRMGKNPFTGEKMRFKAKPSTRKIKARALGKVRQAT